VFTLHYFEHEGQTWWWWRYYGTQAANWLGKVVPAYSPVVIEKIPAIFMTRESALAWARGKKLPINVV